MDIKSIIIICIGIIVFSIFLYYVIPKSQSIGIINQTNVLKTPPPAVTADNLQRPDSTRYSYALWIYVNSWNTLDNKVIFSRYNDIVLYLDKQTATLKCQISPQTSPALPSAIINVDKLLLPSSLSSKDQVVTITNNFSLQKWVYIVISVDNSILDMYLDGKLVKSVQISQPIPDTTSPLFFGSGYDATIASFQRSPNPVDPSTVWTNYMKGNGSSLSNTFGSYNINMNVLKDNVVAASYSVY